MRHTLQIEEQTIDFLFNENANCWQTVAKIDNQQIEIEIDFKFHRQSSVDWEHFTDFFRFVSIGNRLQELAAIGLPLVTEVGKTYFRRCADEIKDWKMKFKNSIFYNGKVDEFNQKDKHSYSILYEYLIEKDRSIDGDTYGLYLVDLENLQVVGARRIQC